MFYFKSDEEIQTSSQAELHDAARCLLKRFQHPPREEEEREAETPDGIDELAAPPAVYREPLACVVRTKIHWISTEFKPAERLGIMAFFFEQALRSSVDPLDVVEVLSKYWEKLDPNGMVSIEVLMNAYLQEDVEKIRGLLVVPTPEKNLKSRLGRILGKVFGQFTPNRGSS